MRQASLQQRDDAKSLEGRGALCRRGKYQIPDGCAGLEASAPGNRIRRANQLSRLKGACCE
jgi:hypothetical protein